MRIPTLLIITLCCLSACANGHDGMTLRETHGLAEVIDTIEEKPFRVIIDATAIIEAPDTTPSAKLYALGARSKAESLTPSPDWNAVAADLETMLGLAEPFSDYHRSTAIDLAKLALQSRDYANAVSLLTMPNLARTEEDRALLEKTLSAMLYLGLINSTEIEEIRQAGRSPQNHDVRPIIRTPPFKFHRCFGRDSAEERVSVRFDVDERGHPENARVARTTDSCFGHYAVRAVETWRYEPAMLAGVPVRRPDVAAVISFSTERGATVEEASSPFNH